jgi:subtilisin family serine protease
MSFVRNATVVLVALGASAVSAAQQVHHVDADSAGGDGTSWATAFDTLTAALAAAQPGDQVWVAEGTYTPAPPGGPRTATFALASGVELFGGFAGGETSLAQRDPEAFVALLSGDLDGDDGAPGANAENSLHVVSAFGADATARLDGFTVRAGNADGAGFPGVDGAGAGLFVQRGGPTIARCVFEDNTSADDGGSVHLGNGTTVNFERCTFRTSSAGARGGAAYGFAALPVFADCAFESNGAARGGALAFDLSEVVLTRCSFEGNTADEGGALFAFATHLTAERSVFLANAAQRGGAVLEHIGLSRFEACRFLGNASSAGSAGPGDGGALFALEGRTDVVSCVLSGNLADGSGGALLLASGELALVNSTLAANAADASGGGAGQGGGLFAAVPGARVVNSILWNNADAGGTGPSAQLGGAPAQVDWSCVQGLPTAGSNNIAQDPLFHDAVGADGVAGTEDDDLRPFLGSPCIDAADADADSSAELGLQALPLFDVAGLPRFADDPFTPDGGNGGRPVVDMGAHEYHDCDANAVPDYVDIEVGNAFDCDGDGQLDSCVPVLGACCFFNLSCVQTSQIDCSSSGGAWQGCGTPCNPGACGVPCPPPFPPPLLAVQGPLVQRQGARGPGALGPIAAALLAPPATSISCQVPAAWQASPVVWARDQSPVNKIEDRIDADGVGPFDVVVNFGDCVTAGDVQSLAGLGTVQRVGRYISFVAVGGVSYPALQLIAQDPRVAFIERQFGFSPTEDLSVPALRVTPSGTYSPSTVVDAFPGIDGTGINIAIMDSGVDNTLHECFAATPFIGGYDALTSTFGDPDDDQSHGTFVASIALGQATAAYPVGYPGIGVSRGMAPGAGLIDIKVFDNAINPISCANSAATWNNITDGLETVLAQHQLWQASGGTSGWKVDVINMSLRQCDSFADGCTVSSDGLDAFSQMVDLCAALGIVVVAAMGNDGDETGACFLNDVDCHPHLTGPSTPGAATRAITVGASFDSGTVLRSDDVHACFTTRGARLSDSDLDPLDELKPEVCAPGDSIHTAFFNTTSLGFSGAFGTSMAAPHVAGLAALILQAKPGMTPGQVKDLIICTAEPIDPPSATSVDPVWNNRSGWGLVDAYAALSKLLVTDLTFDNHPANPPWNSIDITTSSLPPMVGVPTTVTAMVQNLGPTTAMNAHVQFGVHVYSASTPVFHHIGTKIVTLPLGVTAVSIQWIPLNASHQCLHVEIAYGADTVPTNNVAARNLSVAASPVTFQVANDVTDDEIEIGFEVSCPIGDATGWQVLFDPPKVKLSPLDCPATIQVTALPPFTAAAGATISVDVAAVVQDGPLAGQVLGGVTFLVAKKDCNGNGIDDFVEIQSGLAADCDGDGVPDSCAIRSGAAADCNGNGVPDTCDIGTISRDANHDGIPDECLLTPWVGPLLPGGPKLPD